MSKDKISDYSATANSNTDIAGINIDEGCAPSGINNAIRTLMKQLKDWQSGSQDVYITPAGSAAAPAVTTTGDTNTGIYFPAADKISLVTGGTAAVTIDTSQNVGIGTSSPSEKLGVVSSTTSSKAYFTNSQQTLYFGAANGEGQIYGTGAYPLVIYTNASERMRIDSSGNLLVGTTSNAGSNSNSFLALPQSGGCFTVTQHASGSASGFPYAYFNYNGSTIGSITQNGTTAVAYNTSSDYRLKENVEPIQNALDKVTQLKPVTYTWKDTDGEVGEGFIAHELQEIFPEAVSGEKDAVDAEGKPVTTHEETPAATTATTATEVKEDGTTEYTRPLPGGERLYPETDFATIVVDKQWLGKIKTPETWEQKAKRFSATTVLLCMKSTRYSSMATTSPNSGMD